jgi:uncharacterized membrane protein YjjP (DUF1212 family)
MTYTELSGVNSSTIEGILTYPLTGDYYFYAKILFGLFTIFTLTLYFEEKARLGRSNFFSCMAISSIGIIVIAFAGSLIGIITNDILIISLVLTGILVVVWMLTSEN